MEEVKEITTSPLPEMVPESPSDADQTMDFPSAMREVMIGKRIQRLEWHDSEYGVLKHFKWKDDKTGEIIDGDFLAIHKREEDHIWSVSAGDLMAEDWVSF